MTEAYTIKGSFSFEVQASSEEQAMRFFSDRAAATSFVMQGTSINKATRAPDEWAVGMLVEYVGTSEWAWGRGTKGRVIRLDELKDGEKRPSGDKYQVFWVSPFNKDGEISKTAPIWWTTPQDVVWIEEESA